MTPMAPPAEKHATPRRLETRFAFLDGALGGLLAWERRFVAGVMSPGVTVGALSMSRGNGKTALCGALAASVLHPEGDFHAPGREVVCVAGSHGQARLIFEDVLRIVDPPAGRTEWKIWNQLGGARIEHLASGARVRCLGSDPRRAHGIRPWLAILDEGAQWPSATGEKMVAALQTSLGKVEGSRMIAIGTRPDSPSHWFARLLSGGADYCEVYSGDPGGDPMSWREVVRANPSLPAMPALRKQLHAERERARRDPAELASWKALRLNLGTSDTTESVLLDADQWAAAEGDASPTGPCIWGVDLGGTVSGSAVSAYWPETGRLDALMAFPRRPDLRDRGLRDGVGRLYLDCHAEGRLLTLGGEAVDYPSLFRAALRRFGPPAALIADRWKRGELRDSLVGADVPGAPVDLRGQGFKDGAEDVRRFRRAFAEGKVAPVPSLLLRSGMAEARTVSDPAGNQKLAKSSQGGRRERARDDMVAAAILAVSAGQRWKLRPAEPMEWVRVSAQ